MQDSRGRDVAAGALFQALADRYGPEEGQRVYYAMARERTGPFAPGAKYGHHLPLPAMEPGRHMRPPRAEVKR